MSLPMKKKKIRVRGGDRVLLSFVYVALTLLTLVILIPLMHVLSASLSEPQAVIEGKVLIWPVLPTLRGYEAVFRYPPILIGFRNSLIYMLLGTGVNLLMTMLAAYPLSRREFRARRPVSALFMFTMIFSGGMVPTYILVVNLLHLDNKIWSMILPGALSVWNLMIARTYMQNTIPDELYEAASIDGCSPAGYLWRCVFPLSKPILAVLGLYYGVGHWNSYFNALLYLNDSSLQPLQIKLRELLVLNKIDPTMVTNVQAMAAKQGMTDLLKYSTIIVASIPVLMIYPFVQRYFVKGVMIGSVKG